MQFHFIIIGILALIIILYLLLPNNECFNNYSKAEIETIINREINVINASYSKIKNFYIQGQTINSLDVQNEKKIIKNSYITIYNAVPSSTDKMTVNNIYYGIATNYGIRKYFNEPNDVIFYSLLDNIRRLRPATTNITNQIKIIIDNYNLIKERQKTNQSIITNKINIKGAFDSIRNDLTTSTDKEQLELIYNNSTSSSLLSILNNPNDSNFNIKLNEIANLIFQQSSQDIITLRGLYFDIKVIYSNGNSSSSVQATTKKTDFNNLLDNIRNRLTNDIDRTTMDNIKSFLQDVLNTPNDESLNLKLMEIDNLLLESTPNLSLLQTYYNELKGLTLETDKNNKKTQIRNLIDVIKNSLSNLSDKQKLDVIFMGPNPNNLGIVVYLDEIDDVKFNELIMKTRSLLPAIINVDNYKYGIIDEIKVIFNEINSIYRDVYINKLFTYDNKKDEITQKINLIYAKLLVITTMERINELGISLILNTNLKRAYELNDTIDINTNKLSFEEKLNTLRIDRPLAVNNPNVNIPLLGKDDKITDIRGISDSSIYAMPLEDTIKSTPSSKITREFTIDNITEDFNNIYNAFELINIIYNNNIHELSQVNNYRRIINTSLDNISNYYPNNLEYKNKVISIRNVIIKPIIDNELYNAYLNKNLTLIATLRDRFLNAINELKNLVIKNYGKKNTPSNNNICVNNIVDAINKNKYPFKISNIKGCDVSMFGDRDLLISQKMFVSADDGGLWKPATKLADYKKNGINNYPYLYNYGIAVSNDNGNNWNMI